ncbi:MAG: DUF2169 domain-containing protein [Lamprocystis purpurea]|uniref:DUF2169 family type VI secretion system accessory protein n=1 Tax=Lamprocystis purpurea TaxID=61598 RepID=UPI00039B08E3|nr:DUF2169 domain-containing protein [Lamprocystis purpurea]MBV5273228.1 DUF2169 domain-containing protein [Lamprocystis purpurea]
MELINATRMVVGYTMGMEPSGRELLVVVIKGTFALPRTSGESLSLAEAQLPLVMADTFTGAPGCSAPVYEVDFAPRKQRMDILLLGSAYAPGERPAARVPVSLRVNGITKSFAAVGIRLWQVASTGVSVSATHPFTVMPISYDRAFGGVDNRHQDPAKHAAFMRNPVGKGFHRHLKPEWVDGAPLPNTEELNRPITRPDGDYLPMAFGPIGRGWEPRLRYAGTYDQRWLDEDFPFLPPDFDDQYYQAAPLDQQIACPTGPLEIGLLNLTPDGRRGFSLPHFDAPVHIFPKRGDREDLKATLDTLVLEPDLERFTLTWRVTRPLKQNIFEIAQVLVGKKGKDWWQAREEVSFSPPLEPDTERKPEPELEKVDPGPAPQS